MDTIKMRAESYRTESRKNNKEKSILNTWFFKKEIKLIYV